MVYIYGGSFTSGSADYSVYRGDALVRYAQREKRDFVYVSMK
jgi:carboxylesterase type B